MTWLAGEHPERVAGLVYFDAAYDRIALREVVRRPSTRQEPPSTPADLVSPAAYTACMSRGMGMQVPLGECSRASRSTTAVASLVPAGNAAVAPQIMRAVIRPAYDRVRAPVLALLAVADNPTTPLAVFNAAERDRFSRAMPSARVVAIPHSKHYFILTNRAEVVHETREFESRPT